MGLSAFLVGFTVEPKDKKDRVFRAMLWINGSFFVSGLIVPLSRCFRAVQARLLEQSFWRYGARFTFRSARSDTVISEKAEPKHKCLSSSENGAWAYGR
jgi:hypothetical protein